MRNSEPARLDRQELKALYLERQELLRKLSEALEKETREALSNVKHIDRVVFRVKSMESFLAKALDPSNDPPYTEPLREIEDQVAGRVIVFFYTDLELVENHLQRTFNAVEHSRRRPPRDKEFGYESNHLICTIPPQHKPSGWSKLTTAPATFELQIRTLFMHAYAEPQHDIEYKTSIDLPPDIRRQLAWIAASAWGADQALLRLQEWSHIAQKRNKPLDPQRL